MSTYQYGPQEKNVGQITASDVVKIEFALFDSTTPTTPKTSVAFGSATVTVCKPGASSFSAWPASPGWGTGNWAELGNGWYQIILTGSVAAELALLDTVGPIKFNVTVSGAICPPISRTIVAQTQVVAAARTLLALPAVAPDLPGGLATEDANGNLAVDLVYAHGAALTETVHGYLAAALVKLFDVATPVLVASDVMRGTDGAITSLSGIATATNVSDVQTHGDTNWTTATGFELDGAAAAALASYDPPTKDELDSGLAGLNDPTAGEVATAILAATVGFSGATDKTVAEVLQAAWVQGAGKWTVVGTTLTLYEPDGTTPLVELTLDAVEPTSRTPA